MMYSSWDIESNRHNFLSFWTVFCPSIELENQNLEKIKKTPEDIIILQYHTKNHNHMLYCSWDMVHDGCNYFSFWAIFCPFTLLTARKIKIFKKWKKTPGDITLLHKCFKNHDHMLYCSWDKVRDRRNCYFSFLNIFCLVWIVFG